jgi:uncharacterized Zn finger protein
MPFPDLTWDDLREWAGARVLARGKSYRRAVEDLRMTVDGRLLAWVQGGERYATVVSMSKSGELASVCTCPYGLACKHAVAMVLTYLGAVQAGEPIPAADDEDERLEALAHAHDDEDEEEELDEDEAPAPVVPRKRLATRSRAAKPEATEQRYLKSLSRPALLELVRQLSADFPQVRQRIVDRADLQNGDVATLVANTRREIVKVSADPGWTRHWSNERHIPDYSRVQKRLQSLLNSGHADEVVALGDDLWRRGLEQIGMSNDEGETGWEIAGCMKVVFHALESSSLTGSKRLIWLLDMRLRDNYGILDGIDDPLANRAAFTAADWAIVADELARRMAGILVSGAERDVAGSDGGYRRQRIMRLLLDALKQAGRGQEITAILEREAEITHCYVELVDHLLAEKQHEAAAAWACKGFERTRETLPGLAWSLEERLRDLAVRAKDGPLVAAFRAMEFFERPEVERYQAVRSATAPLGHWEQVRSLLLGWLETGIRPDLPPPVKTPRRVQGKVLLYVRPIAQEAWPLPPTGLVVSAKTGHACRFPDVNALIAIAIQEKRNDDVLRWYNQVNKRERYGRDYQGESVAAAVENTHPDEALAIWRRLALAQIAVTNPGAYQIAGAHLKRMHAVFLRTGRVAEWEQLLAELRATKPRKPRMLEVLDRLEGKRTRILNT